MKKMVVMMGVHDERSRRRIISTVANFHGVTSITMDSKDGKLTVIGDFDSTKLHTKLEKGWANAEMATFGPYDPKKEAESAAAAAEKKRRKKGNVRGWRLPVEPTVSMVLLLRIIRSVYATMTRTMAA